MRYSVILKLNLQNNSKSVSDSSKDIRCRVWWAIFSAECRLAVMTGRTSSFTGMDFSIPLPIPVEEGLVFQPGNRVFNSHEFQHHRRYSNQESLYTENNYFNQSSSFPTKVNASPTECFAPGLPQVAIPPSDVMYFLL